MSEDYDEIDRLIDTNPIAIGKRCRAAEARLAEAVELLREARDALDHSPAAGNHDLAVKNGTPARCLGCAVEDAIDVWLAKVDADG